MSSDAARGERLRLRLAGELEAGTEQGAADCMAEVRWEAMSGPGDVRWIAA